MLEPKGTYISSQPGWIAQDIFFVPPPLFGGRRVVFPFPTDRLEVTLVGVHPGRSVESGSENMARQA